MSIHFYDSEVQRSTGNFLTKSIKRDLYAGVSVIYIDTTRGFDKHGISRDTENLQIIDSCDLAFLLTVVRDILKTNWEGSIYIDHFEYTTACLEDPLTEDMVTAKYRSLFLVMLNIMYVNTYITCTKLPNKPNTPHIKELMCDYNVTDFSEEICQ